VRFGRIILASLTALAAYSYACEAQSVHATAVAFPRLLQSVMPMLVAAESASPAPAAPASNPAIFTIEALTATSMSGSICLLASLIAVDLYRRRHQRAFLRL
jgi:hypothetical protein